MKEINNTVQITNQIQWSNKMKQLLNQFWLPTPKKMRKIGYSILATCTMLGTGGLIAMDDLQEIFSPGEMKWIIGIVFILGAIGKAITSFFTEDESEAQNGK